MLPCEFCKTFKKTVFAEYLWTTALAPAPVKDPCGLETFTKSYPKKVLAEHFVKLRMSVSSILNEVIKTISFFNRPQ